MRWSRYFLFTLRENPSDADVVSHQQGKQVQVIKHFRDPESAAHSPAAKPAEKVAA